MSRSAGSRRCARCALAFASWRDACLAHRCRRTRAVRWATCSMRVSWRSGSRVVTRPQSRMHSRPSAVRSRLPGCGSLRQHASIACACVGSKPSDRAVLCVPMCVPMCVSRCVCPDVCPDVCVPMCVSRCVCPDVCVPISMSMCVSRCVGAFRRVPTCACANQCSTPVSSIMFMYEFIASEHILGTSSVADVRSRRSPSIHSVVSTRRVLASPITCGAKTLPSSGPPATSSLKYCALVASEV
jgi:hypothetical protein